MLCVVVCRRVMSEYVMFDISEIRGIDVISATSLIPLDIVVGGLILKHSNVTI